MEIAKIKELSFNFQPFLVNDLEGPKDTKKTAVTAVDVPWGYYIASKGKRILTRVYTSSLASCFAYTFWDETHKNFLFAHVSTDGEARSIVDLVQELTSPHALGNLRTALFVCTTGTTPNPTTYNRIKHIIESLHKNHRVCRANSGAVVVDIESRTIIQTKGTAPGNVKVDYGGSAMSKDANLPLEGIKVSSSWIGSAKADAYEPLERVNWGRAGSDPQLKH